MNIEVGDFIRFRSFNDTLEGCVREIVEEGGFLRSREYLVGSRDEFGLGEFVVSEDDVLGFV